MEADDEVRDGKKVNPRRRFNKRRRGFINLRRRFNRHWRRFNFSPYLAGL